MMPIKTRAVQIWEFCAPMNRYGEDRWPYLRGLQDRSWYSAASLTKPVRSRSRAGSEQAVHLVPVAAGDAQRLAMLADRLLVRAFQQAADLAVGVMATLDLPHAELAGSAGPRPRSYLLDGLGREPQVIVETMNLGTGSSRSCITAQLCPGGGHTSIACAASGSPGRAGITPDRGQSTAPSPGSAHVAGRYHPRMSQAVPRGHGPAGASPAGSGCHADGLACVRPWV
jgi:hypothetical protein